VVVSISIIERHKIQSSVSSISSLIPANQVSDFKGDYDKRVCQFGVGKRKVVYQIWVNLALCAQSQNTLDRTLSSIERCD